MNIGVILAGGIGSRMGIKDMPKQFIDVYGKPILIHTLEKFDNNINIDRICIVCLKEYIEDVKILVRKFEINKVDLIVEGGNTRQESVSNALDSLGKICSQDDIVVIHDSVRPLISSRIIDDNIIYAQKYGAVDTVIPASDTIVKSIDNIYIDSIPKRKELYLGQTPQSFRFGLIKEAHKTAKLNNIEDSTDDCQLVLKMNLKVNLVEGDKMNFKITSAEDLTLLKAIVKMG
jgi:2-C-methyl-D-erythritol 4-phosphate cytidylyltransferase